MMITGELKIHQGEANNYPDKLITPFSLLGKTKNKIGMSIRRFFTPQISSMSSHKLTTDRESNARAVLALKHFKYRTLSSLQELVSRYYKR